MACIIFKATFFLFLFIKNGQTLPSTSRKSNFDRTIEGIVLLVLLLITMPYFSIYTLDALFLASAVNVI